MRVDKHFDLAIVVKRPRKESVAAIRKRGIPLVWDVVDAWPQPWGNDWDRDWCLNWLKVQLEELRPSAVMAATEKMAADCEECGVRAFTVPHHFRPGLKTNAIRDKVFVVGYEGALAYVHGRWLSFFEHECNSRGWKFIVNPLAISDLDIVVAARNQAGYAARNWKSGVKGANAQGSGTPCILQRESGCFEQASGGELWADSEEEFSSALDALIDFETRLMASRKLLEHSASLKLEAVAKRCREWLEETVLSS